jgi:hypothetical protein
MVWVADPPSLQDVYTYWQPVPHVTTVFAEIVWLSPTVQLKT